jgi:Asp-tRNA(Asn)/Glu-tRNA(Gln) amidotransferase B subunit
MPRIIVYEVTYLDNVKSNKPIDLDISSSEVLLLNNTEVSEDIYLTLKQMRDEKQHSYTGRNIKLYNFEDFKQKGVCSEDYQYHPDVNSPPILIEGTFVDAFRIVLDNDSMIKKLYRKLNIDVVYSFSIYTDDSKMLEFVYGITDGQKYQGVPANMFYLLKKLLNK